MDFRMRQEREAMKRTSHNPKVVSSSLTPATRFIKKFKVPWLFIFEKNGGNLRSILAKFENHDIIRKNIN